MDNQIKMQAAYFCTRRCTVSEKILLETGLLAINSVNKQPALLN